MGKRGKKIEENKEVTKKTAQRMYCEHKLSRVLTDMGVDFEEVSKRYREDSRRGRTLKEPTVGEIAIVEEFQKSGDFATLKKDLGVNNGKATTILASVVAYQARNRSHIISETE